MTLEQFDLLDDDYRDVLLADHLHDQEMCSKCGLPISVCSDPEREWYPQRRICRAQMETAAANRMYAKLHEDRQWHDGTFTLWFSQWSLAAPYSYDDGVTVFASVIDADPDDDFLKPPDLGLVEPGEAVV